MGQGRTFNSSAVAQQRAAGLRLNSGGLGRGLGQCKKTRTNNPQGRITSGWAPARPPQRHVTQAPPSVRGTRLLGVAHVCTTAQLATWIGAQFQ